MLLVRFAVGATFHLSKTSCGPTTDSCALDLDRMECVASKVTPPLQSWIIWPALECEDILACCTLHRFCTLQRKAFCTKFDWIFRRWYRPMNWISLHNFFMPYAALLFTYSIQLIVYCTDAICAMCIKCKMYKMTYNKWHTSRCVYCSLHTVHSVHHRDCGRYSVEHFLGDRCLYIVRRVLNMYTVQIHCIKYTSYSVRSIQCTSYTWYIQCTTQRACSGTYVCIYTIYCTTCITYTYRLYKAQRRALPRGQMSGEESGQWMNEKFSCSQQQEEEDICALVYHIYYLLCTIYYLLYTTYYLQYIYSNIHI